jgi:hypothetical protein
MSKVTVAILADRMRKIEDTMEELAVVVKALKEQDKADSGGRKLDWVLYVDPTDFLPLKENGYYCETDNCHNGTFVEDDGEAAEEDEASSLAHWQHIGEPNYDVDIPEYICSECMAEVIRENS